MAVGVLTINTGRYQVQRPIRARGLRIITGDIVFSANSSFVASTIEKRFRSRCRDIQISVPSGVNVEYLRSTTHKAGMLYVFGVAKHTGTSTNATNTAFSAVKMVGAVVSGTFIAVGT